MNEGAPSARVVGRGSIGIAGAVMAAVLLMGSTAWGCTPQSTIYPLMPAAAERGEKLAVSGELLQSGKAEIRWNSVAGPGIASVELSDTMARTFSTEVIVPEAAPGVYYLVLVSDDEAVARTALEVSDVDGGEPRFATDAFTRGSPTSARPQPGAPLGVGVGLLGVGLVALSAGAMAAGRARRRAYATRHR